MSTHLATILHLDGAATARIVLLAPARRALARAAEVLEILGTASEDPEIELAREGLVKLLDDYAMPVRPTTRRRSPAVAAQRELPKGDRVTT